jgi:hypothetical protein
VAEALVQHELHKPAPPGAVFRCPLEGSAALPKHHLPGATEACIGRLGVKTAAKSLRYGRIVEADAAAEVKKRPDGVEKDRPHAG